MPPKTNRPNRLKAPATPVPQTLDEANAAIRAIGAAQRELTRIETAMAEEMADVKERYENMAAAHKHAVSSLSTALQVWCEANRATLTKDGKVKTADLPAGQIGWRMRPPSVRVTGTEAVLDTLRRLGLLRFIRTKDEVNKEAILNEAEVAAAVPGISIAQGEDFFVVPFEAELAEVA